MLRIFNYVVYLVAAVGLLAESVQRLEPGVVSGCFWGFARRRHSSIFGSRAIPVFVLLIITKRKKGGNDIYIDIMKYEALSRDSAEHQFPMTKFYIVFFLFYLHLDTFRFSIEIELIRGP